MQRVSILLAVAVGVVAVGCRREAGPAPTSRFSGKLAAAKAIRDGVTRDQALQTVAVDAAAVGEAAVTAEAIGEIKDGVTRDNTASESVDALIASGLYDEAAALAAKISDDVTRDNALKRVAEGRTVLMVEHNMKVVASIADRITVLARGAVLAEGDYATVSRHPAVLEAYMGTEATELVGAH